MTNQEILEKAIQKAIDGGWKDGANLHADKSGSLYRTYPTATDGIHIYGSDTSVKEVLFNHDFAKALWRMPCVDRNPLCSTCKPWQYHLQMMVVAEDPIAYLGENI